MKINTVDNGTGRFTVVHNTIVLDGEGIEGVLSINRDCAVVNGNVQTVVAEVVFSYCRCLGERVLPWSI